MNNSYIDRAVEELELAVINENAHRTYQAPRDQDIFKAIKQPKVFPKVEYSPCVTVVDNRK